MQELLTTVNGLDILALSVGAGVMAAVYEGTLHRMRRHFDDRLDVTWDRAYDEGWMDGCRAGRSIDRAIASIMERGASDE